MTVYVESRPSLLRNFWTPSGISKESDTIQAELRDACIHSRKTASALWRQSAQAEVREIMLDCSKEGWDGYDAAPISQESSLAALEVINLLPENTIPPSIAPEPSGDIALEWRNGNHILFSLSVTGRDIVYAAILGGGSKLHGQERYFDSLPRPVLDILTRYFRKA
jgi:hypothetical protein